MHVKTSESKTSEQRNRYEPYMGLSCDMENIQSTKTFVLKTRHQITITQGRAFSGTAYAARTDERGLP